MNPTSNIPVILVVAPQGELRHSLAFMLTAEGFAVRTQPDCSTAAMSVGNLDCLIIDEAAIDGLKKLGGQGFYSTHTILLVSRFRQRPLLPNAIEVYKPLTTNVLLNELRRLLQPGYG